MYIFIKKNFIKEFLTIIKDFLESKIIINTEENKIKFIYFFSDLLILTCLIHLLNSNKINEEDFNYFREIRIKFLYDYRYNIPIYANKLYIAHKNNDEINRIIRKNFLKIFIELKLDFENKIYFGN